MVNTGKGKINHLDIPKRKDVKNYSPLTLPI